MRQVLPAGAEAKTPSSNHDRAGEIAKTIMNARNGCSTQQPADQRGTQPDHDGAQHDHAQDASEQTQAPNTVVSKTSSGSVSPMLDLGQFCIPKESAIN